MNLLVLLPLLFASPDSISDARKEKVEAAANSFAELANWAFDVDLFRECGALVREVNRVLPGHEVSSLIKSIEDVNPTDYVNRYRRAHNKHRRAYAKKLDAIAVPLADELVRLAELTENETESEALYVEAVHYVSDHKAAGKALKKLDYDVVFNYGVLPKEDKESARATLKRLRGGFLGRRDLKDELEFWSDGWGLETRNFQFITNASHQSVFAFAQACEDLFSAWEQVMAPGKLSMRPLKRRAVIYFFDSPATYQTILRSTETDVPSADEVLGYYSSETKIGYFYDRPDFYAGDLTLLFETFYHEGTHQLDDLRIKSAWRGVESKYPMGWFGEGFALYMELLEIDIKGGKRTFRIGGFVDDDLGVGLGAYLADALMDSRKFLHISASEFSEYGLGYPHAALLMHFLMEWNDRELRKGTLSLIDDVRKSGGLKKPLWKSLGLKEDEFFEALDTHIRETVSTLPQRKYKDD